MGNVFWGVEAINSLIFASFTRPCFQQGEATFTGPRTVSVDGVEYEGEHILIAVGGRPTLPNIPGAELCDTSDEFFEWETLPNKVLVIGAGYIAVEIAGGHCSYLLLNSCENFLAFDGSNSRLGVLSNSKLIFPDIVPRNST